MKKFKVNQLAYDVMRAKEMSEIQGGVSDRSYCLYCGRPAMNPGGYFCGICRPVCALCGKILEIGEQHSCNGTGGRDIEC